MGALNAKFKFYECMLKLAIQTFLLIVSIIHGMYLMCFNTMDDMHILYPTSVYRLHYTVSASAYRQ